MDPQVIIKNLTNRAQSRQTKLYLNRGGGRNNLLGKEEGKEKSYTHLHVLIIYIYIISTDKHDTRMWYHDAVF